MAKRLTRIYTRTGDDGTTGLAGGERLPKDHLRIEAIGAVDELNSVIGLLRAQPLEAAIDRLLRDHTASPVRPRRRAGHAGNRAVNQAHTTELERALDELNADLPALEEFILPGGNEAAARCHVARTGCSSRRARRCCDFRARSR